MRFEVAKLFLVTYQKGLHLLEAVLETIFVAFKLSGAVFLRKVKNYFGPIPYTTHGAQLPFPLIFNFWLSARSFKIDAHTSYLYFFFLFFKIKG